ncbi:MAG: hypothetical protein C5B47_01975 [Verrucomicrobia bacterium]|nr:MAG: hypothetical protein C5B47_01975 [Verrucomicrobiota bacterium]
MSRIDPPSLSSQLTFSNRDHPERSEYNRSEVANIITINRPFPQNCSVSTLTALCLRTLPTWMSRVENDPIQTQYLADRLAGTRRADFGIQDIQSLPTEWFFALLQSPNLRDHVFSVDFLSKLNINQRNDLINSGWLYRAPEDLRQRFYNALLINSPETLTLDLASNIPGQMWVGMMENQRSRLNAVTVQVLERNAHNFQEAQSLTEQQIRILQQPGDRILVEFTSRQISYLNLQNLGLNFWPHFYMAVGPAQLRHVFGSFTREQVASMGSLPLTHPFFDRIGYLSSDVIPVLPVDLMRQIRVNGTQLYMFHAGVRNRGEERWLWTSAHFAALTQAQRAVLHPSVLAFFEKMRWIETDTISQLSSDQLIESAFAYTREQWEQVSPAQLRNFSRDQVAALLASLDNNQFIWWTPAQCAAVFRWIPLAYATRLLSVIRVSWNFRAIDATRYRDIVRLLIPSDLPTTSNQNIPGTATPRYPLIRIEELDEDFFLYLREDTLQAAAAVMRRTQMTQLSSHAFARFSPAGISALNPETFAGVTAGQLTIISNSPAQVQAITLQQIPLISINTLMNMERESVLNLWRNFTCDQVVALTREQYAFFMAAIRGPLPSDSSRDNQQRGPEGDGDGPTDPNTGARRRWLSRGNISKRFTHFMAAVRNWGGRPGQDISEYILIEDIKNADAKFYHRVRKKPRYSTNDSGGEDVPRYDVEIEEYRQWVQGIPVALLRAIPPSIVPQIHAEFWEALTDVQLASLKPEQKNAITAKMIKIESPSLLPWARAAGTKLELTPNEAKEWVDRIDTKRGLRDALTPNVLRSMQSTSDFYFLSCLEPEHYFKYGENDWNGDQIAALPEKLISEIWDEKYFNQLNLDQKLRIDPKIFAKIRPKVIEGLKVIFFMTSSENNEHQQGLWRLLQALGNKVQYFPIEVIHILIGYKIAGAVQIQQLDIHTIPSSLFRELCGIFGILFLKLLPSQQVSQLSREHLLAIPNNIYAAQLLDSYNARSDAEIESGKYGNLPVKQYRLAIEIIAKSLAKGEIPLTEAQRLNILQGKLDIRIRRNTTPDTSNTSNYYTVTNTQMPTTPIPTLPMEMSERGVYGSIEL